MLSGNCRILSGCQLGHDPNCWKQFVRCQSTGPNRGLLAIPEHSAEWGLEAQPILLGTNSEQHRRESRYTTASRDATRHWATNSRPADFGVRFGKIGLWGFRPYPTDQSPEREPMIERISRNWAVDSDRRCRRLRPGTPSSGARSVRTVCASPELYMRHTYSRAKSTRHAKENRSSVPVIQPAKRLFQRSPRKI